MFHTVSRTEREAYFGFGIRSLLACFVFWVPDYGPFVVEEKTPTSVCTPTDSSHHCLLSLPVFRVSVCECVEKEHNMSLLWHLNTREILTCLSFMWLSSVCCSVNFSDDVTAGVRSVSLLVCVSLSRLHNNYQHHGRKQWRRLFDVVFWAIFTFSLSCCHIFSVTVF